MPTLQEELRQNHGAEISGCGKTKSFPYNHPKGAEQIHVLARNSQCIILQLDQEQKLQGMLSAATEKNKVLERKVAELQSENEGLIKRLAETLDEVKTLREQNESNKSLDGILQCQQEKYLSEIAKLKEQVSEKDIMLKKQSEQYTQLYLKYKKVKELNEPPQINEKPQSKVVLLGKDRLKRSNRRLREYIGECWINSKKKCVEQFLFVHIQQCKIQIENNLMALRQEEDPLSLPTTKIDKEFVVYMLEIENRYSALKKHERIRIEQWSRKLCQATTNIVWKKNRNRYAILLLDQVLNQRLEAPFTSLPPDGGLVVLQQHDVVQVCLKHLKQKARLSPKFYALKAEIDAANPEEKLQALEQDIKTIHKAPEPKPKPPVAKPKARIQSAKKPQIPKPVVPLEELVEKMPEPKEEPPAKKLDPSANAEIIRLQSEIEVMQITVKHTKEELKVFINSFYSAKIRTRKK
eukprot:TRINITY_DN616_c0_g1_i1.p4 TRINITY_DN616_c0_g1~~TRINITY_DN616_c0_g1_i1.p4  ORF type:complete len:465 (+),score=59.27 TRINITY_DN616_c0_g1_i1:268-1662(+)